MLISLWDYNCWIVFVAKTADVWSKSRFEVVQHCGYEWGSFQHERCQWIVEVTWGPIPKTYKNMIAGDTEWVGDGWGTLSDATPSETARWNHSGGKGFDNDDRNSTSMFISQRVPQFVATCHWWLRRTVAIPGIVIHLGHDSHPMGRKWKKQDDSYVIGVLDQVKINTIELL